MEACRLERADTVFGVITDAAWKVLEVERTPSNAGVSPDTIYQRLEQQLSQAYGPPHRCKQSDDLGTADVEFWEHDNVRDEISRNVTRGTVPWSIAVGHGWCHSGP
jgi:hypothetical protein